MKHLFQNRTVTLLLFLSALASCRDITTIDKYYQRVLINNFSAPLRTLLPARNNNPNRLTLRVSGTISKPVMLAVDQFGSDLKRVRVRRDTLAAGTYTNKGFSDDFYSQDAVELLVTGMPGATGSLTIDWYAH
ncbi:MAG: hypothetical protein LH609_09880 [Rudanella sp.]|nr:hypothetical protein [Rudanella sp.]